MMTSSRKILILATLVLFLSSFIPIKTTYASSEMISGNKIIDAGKYQNHFMAQAITYYDYGDAPDPAYATLASSAGAVHLLGSNVYLGACVDADINGQPDASATGDDSSTSSQVFGTCPDVGDEDGVIFPSALLTGQSASIDVTANAACDLSAWIDFNQNGSWMDAGEEIFTGQALSSGVNGLNFTVPASATAGSTFARFRCTTDGAVSFTGAASDGEVEDYQVSIVVQEPEIDIQRPAGTSIANGATDNLGNPLPGTTYNLTYTIDNSAGTAPLGPFPYMETNYQNISSVFVDGSFGSTIPAGGSMTFDLSFTVDSSGPFGMDFWIESNDSDESNYHVVVSGIAQPVSEIDVSGNGNPINNGALTPAIINDTDFGIINTLSGTKANTFTISNTGTADLNLSTGTPHVIISGTNASDFSLTNDAATPIASVGGTTTFTITFDPSTPGTRSATVSIANDDSDENPYNFNIQGTGTFYPEIDIQRPAGTSIANGATDNLGNPLPGTTYNLTYTIDNSAGTAPLGPFPYMETNYQNISSVFVDGSFGSTIPAGGSMTFDLSFTVDSPGPFGMDFWIDSNDFDEANYHVVVSGVASELLVLSSANTSPIDGDMLAVGPSNLSVQFNREVETGGGPGAGDNPANYLLVEDGPSDNGFDTVSCLGGLVADDTSVEINSISYDSATDTATLNANGGANLPAGSYRLYVCGTTSVEDLIGNELNGGLFDTLINFTVAAAAPQEILPIATPAQTLPATGFPMGYKTLIPDQPLEKAYTASDMILDLPELNQKLSIVGVPHSQESWDVSWLGSSAGWLNGSAYPTWVGNTVLTGHVWDANNQPGVFADLKSLKYGDQFYIHAWGQTYTYEVRENKLVSAGNTKAVVKHETLDWITLLTCESYNPNAQTYPFRRMVRAVLLKVE
ncbi:MAG: sortase [Anaerolineaceae bacterium]|nr:sortase [Anaerolineaceae bacterium]